MRTKIVIETDYREIEEMIMEEYGIEYEIMPMEEVGSSQYAATYTQHVTPTKPDTDYEKECLQNFIDGKPTQYTLNLILNDMCCKDLLKQGEYIIDVNW